jgi:nitrogen regulatory protein P-II 2
MKLLHAYIQPHKLNDVKKALYEQDIKRFSVMSVYGHSEEDGIHESYRGIEIEVDLLKKIKIEIALNDDFVKIAVEAIQKACSTGTVGDGKIFITPLENAFRIRSNEQDSVAIG